MYASSLSCKNNSLDKLKLQKVIRVSSGGGGGGGDAPAGGGGMHQQGVGGRGRGDAPAGGGGKRGCTPSAKMLDEEVGLDLGISICVCMQYVTMVLSQTQTITR